MYIVMKYKIIFIIIIIIIIIGLIIYNNNIYEKFINDNKDKVTDICNARQKLDLEVCNNKNIKGDPGERGDIGRTGTKGVKGDKGDKGNDGMNGKHAYCIGNFVFKDENEDIIPNSEINCDDTYNNLVDKETIVRIPDGERGLNARMNPIIFVDGSNSAFSGDTNFQDLQMSDIPADSIISIQYIENNDLPAIIVPIEKGDTGDNGKDAIQIDPELPEHLEHSDKVVCSIKGLQGDQGNQGEPGDKGPRNTQDGTQGPQGHKGGILKEPNFDTLETQGLLMLSNSGGEDVAIFSEYCSLITNEKIIKASEIIKSELEYLRTSSDEIQRKTAASQALADDDTQKKCSVY